MMVAWERLIRFVATDGRVLRGEPILPTPDFDLGSTTAETELKAKVIVGDDIYDTTGKTVVSDEVVVVKQLLGPLAQEDVPIIRCIGLNYKKHSMSSILISKEFRPRFRPRINHQRRSVLLLEIWTFTDVEILSLFSTRGSPNATAVPFHFL